MKITRKGFTLVELLIVIVVIGILAAMMMLSSSEAVSSARASTIITNLRNLKTAALAMYNDNMDTYDTKAKDQNGLRAIDETGYNVFKYLTAKGNDVPDKNDYKLCIVATEEDGNMFKNGWYIVYKANDLKGNEGTRIRDKLAGRAKSIGLISMGKDGKAPEGSSTNLTAYDGSDKWVGIQVR